ncbi:hypothetical protein [Cellulosilyticum sp. I15G10I2]|uniref:hypothetical protein n=1 Tax=Cellulosilyticum sp. I15G10I2 TaxID=1892843 RepID=UPI00085BDEB0|nr:hypothetical protein [Cellulosilyticum sp. I15G10I2]
MIFTDDQFVRIGGVLLPGLFKSLEITGSAMVEEIEVKGKGKKPKQATGYEDCKVNIEIVLMDDSKKTALEKLEIIQSIFRTKGQAKPKVYDMVNQHAIRRGISKVIFKELSSRETSKKEELIVSLTFWEYEAINVSAIKSNNSKSKTTTSGSQVGSDYKSYLNDNRGTAPRVADKTVSTPAREITPAMVGRM